MTVRYLKYDDTVRVLESGGGRWLAEKDLEEVTAAEFERIQEEVTERYLNDPDKSELMRGLNARAKELVQELLLESTVVRETLEKMIEERMIAHLLMASPHSGQPN